MAIYFDFQDLPENIQKDFADAVGVDYSNGTSIDFYIEKLDESFEKYNNVVDFFLSEGIDECEYVEVYYWW